MPTHFLPFGLSVQRLENVLQTLNVAFGLFQMLFEASSEFVRGRSFGHLWKRLEQLILCAKQVFSIRPHTVFSNYRLACFLHEMSFGRWAKAQRGGPASPLKMGGSEPRSRRREATVRCTP
jgi:hypothetical protein